MSSKVLKIYFTGLTLLSYFPLGVQQYVILTCKSLIMRKLILLPVFVLLFSGVSFSQPDSLYAVTLKKMILASGSQASYDAVVTQVIGVFKSNFDEQNPEFFDLLEAELKQFMVDDLVNMLVPVYQKYLTKEDLEGLIQFYETPAGKKFAQMAPDIARESMTIGQAWGMKIGDEIMKKLEEKRK